MSFVTLGCAKNEVDTAHMKKQLAAAGFLFAEDPGSADAVVVNTCSFIQAATEESLEAIFDIAGRENFAQGRAKLVVAGCMPARYGDELVDELPEAACFVPCSKEDDIVAVLAGLFPDFVVGAKDLADQTPQEGSVAPSEGADAGVVADTVAAAAETPLSAYVKISDGCDRFCSYCTIPYIRGRYHSYPQAAIVAEVEEQRAAGVREIVLIAQDTGRWGTDFEQPSTLADLMEHLATAYPETWFRVMYLQPEGISDQLLACVARYDNICSYFDIPLQHVDASILRAMNRTGSRKEFEALLAHIRACVPDVTLRTTLIAGFPGESEAAFEELCDFIQDADFDYVGVFPYSCEEGTRAATLPGQIDEETKLERAQALRDSADSVSVARIAARIGTQLDVLVLGLEEDGQWYGRARCQAPDVDGVTYIAQGNAGEIKRVTIVDTLLYEMEGE
ncbi:MAG: 30S ribosomal protein S12 methylthiotransferase RimO [Raoultibacter sp.]